MLLKWVKKVSAGIFKKMLSTKKCEYINNDLEISPDGSNKETFGEWIWGYL